MDTQRTPTGISGLDAVLQGGVPSSRLYLVLGSPGTGKTTLALQFLMEGARNGETVLFITLSESADELQVTARSHGWDISGVEIFELSAADQLVDLDLQQTIFPPAEVELTETTNALISTLERLRPTRIVFDTLSDLRMMAGAALTYRRQLLFLKQRLIEYRATVLLLEDDLEEGEDIQSVVHGVIALENPAPDYGGERRRIRIAKMRGTPFVGGYHDFRILTGGIEIYPRLVAADSRAPATGGQIATGVPGLDEMLGSGLELGTAALIMGPAGSGKSTIVMQSAASAANQGMKTAMYLFDERPQTLFARADALGMGFQKHVDDGTITVQQIDPAELSPGEFYSLIQVAVQRDNVQVVVIDSLSGFLNAMPSERYLILQLHELMTYLAQKGVTTLMVLGQTGTRDGFQSPVDISYLADTVLQTGYFERDGETRTSVAVFKRRTGMHDRTTRELIFVSGGLQVDRDNTIRPSVILRGVNDFGGDSGGGK
ncbi:MAG: ATPase domain-containing protein [Dehalococcoidia bacterium]